MRGAEWPDAAKIRNWSLAIVAHSRGGTGDGGHYAFERGPGAMWAGTLDVPPMCSEDAAEFRAFLHSLRGRAGTFTVALPKRPRADSCARRIAGKTLFDDCTRFSDTTSFGDLFVHLAPAVSGTLTATAAADAATLSLSGVTGMQAGDWIVAGGQLFRAVSFSGNDVTVRPRVRTAIASAAAFTAVQVTATFRLATDAPLVAFIPGRSTETQISIEEAY